jgi:Domain of unknown function (DUF4291)
MERTQDGQVGFRQVRAAFDDESLVVYQAYPPQIADRALMAGRFVPPFKFDRMTWIKPSFLWMMHRSAWATAPSQERVLAVRMKRSGFEWALAHASLSQYDKEIYASETAWLRCKASSPVRVQWDPERSLDLKPLRLRTIQVGLSGEATRMYVSEWIIELRDVTSTAHEIRRCVADGDSAAAWKLIPVEAPLPLPGPLARSVGASVTDD